jgi:HD-GYP domain-containing protein (c-di-GMP phosphodiesterase class II)
MMTISDIYDALTASDRPYKKAVPPERALDILSSEAKLGFVDSNLFQLFLDAKVYSVNSSK